MKFKYHKFKVVGSPFPTLTEKKTPIISVFVKYRNRARRHYVLVDSGADNCIMHSKFGELMGIDVKSGIETKFYGINKKEYSIGYVHHVSLYVGDVVLKKVPVVFTDSIINETYGVVGQYGFFDKFKITFDYKNGSIDLK